MSDCPECGSEIVTMAGEFQRSVDQPRKNLRTNETWQRYRCSSCESMFAILEDRDMESIQKATQI